MTIMTVKQVAALRLMLSVEKTTRNAEAIRNGRESGESDVNLALACSYEFEKWARVDIALEDASLGKTDPNEQVRVALGPDFLNRLHGLVLAGAYISVNHDACDEEGSALAVTLMNERDPLLRILETKIGVTPGLFPVQTRGPVLFN